MTLHCLNKLVPSACRKSSNSIKIQSTKIFLQAATNHKKVNQICRVFQKDATLSRNSVWNSKKSWVKRSKPCLQKTEVANFKKCLLSNLLANIDISATINPMVVLIVFLQSTWLKNHQGLGVYRPKEKCSTKMTAQSPKSWISFDSCARNAKSSRTN